MGCASAHFIDVPKKIADQGFNTAELVRFFATAEVAVIAFAGFVVVSEHRASIDDP